MHMPRLLRRPRLEGRRVAAHRREVAVVQPIQNLLFLRDARPALAVVARLVRAERRGTALLRRLAVVGFFPAATDEQDVADVDVAALGGGADVETLGFATCRELRVGNGVAIEGIVSYALTAGVGAIVEEDSPAGDTVLRPMMDGAFIVGGGADNVGAFGAVVEVACGYVGEL